MFPQDASGGWMPMPTYESAASSWIAVATPSVHEDEHVGRTCGTTWRSRIHARRLAGRPRGEHELALAQRHDLGEDEAGEVGAEADADDQHDRR